MAEKIVVMRTEGASAPAPEVDRSTTTWNHWTGENGRLLCGIWESEPGKSDVDYTEWDPRIDRHLPIHYGPRELANKADLKRNFLLRNNLRPVKGREPLFGIVSRLTPQKGFDLLMETLPALLEKHEIRLAVLGSGDKRYEAFFTGLAERHRGRAWFFGGHDEALAHWVEGASDIFLMPSQYEPCGLNQMYSLRYGTIPVVRRTGGLADSVVHFDPATGNGTGIVFNDFDAAGMNWALNTALEWYAQPRLWDRIVQNAMGQDFSWGTQANEYLKLFAALLQLDAAALVKGDAPQETAR